jgi:hypothetical protein
MVVVLLHNSAEETCYTIEDKIRKSILYNKKTVPIVTALRCARTQTNHTGSVKHHFSKLVAKYTLIALCA